VRSLREIVKYAEKGKIKLMLENVPLSNGLHDIVEFKYITDKVASLFVHLGGMESVLNYINIFGDKIIHIRRRKEY
jgi:hypothetical protein